MFQSPIGPLLAIFESPANLESGKTQLQIKRRFMNDRMFYLFIYHFLKKENDINDGMPSGILRQFALSAFTELTTDFPSWLLT